MKFQRRVRQDIDVNMTPLIDVVFLLLIFFMVSTTFTKDSHIGIVLPKAQISAQAEANTDPLQLVIDAHGVYKLDGKVVLSSDVASLKQALTAWLKNKQADKNSDPLNQPIVISADAQTAHQFVVIAMDVAGQLGFSKLSIATIEHAQP